MNKIKIVVFDDGETWGLWSQVYIQEVTEEELAKLYDGEYPKRLDSYNTQVEVAETILTLNPNF